MSTIANHPIVQPYLFFNGRCAEALDFYRQALGAEVEMMLRFQDSPEPLPPGAVPPGFESKIMHASFRLGATSLMASDGCSAEPPSFQGFSLSFSVATAEAADRAFAALAEGGQVRMQLAKTFWSPRFGMVEDRFGIGWMIAVMPPSTPFIISRTFEAPRERVWQAWTERERLMQWYGPKGFTMPTAKSDLHPGGQLHYCLRAADGMEIWGKWGYRVIDAPARLVWVEYFSDQHGGLARHPLSATWPLEILSAATFADEDGKTKLTIEWLPLNPTDEERRTFDAAHAEMRQGWGGTLDQLAAYLAGAWQHPRVGVDANSAALLVRE
jgi:PhnB protein